MKGTPDPEIRVR